MSSEQSNHKRQWRDYQTEGGTRPVKDFLLELPDEDRAAIQKPIVSFLLVKDVLITYYSL